MPTALSALPRQESVSQVAWGSYISDLPWELGSLDDSSYKAALRGASLGVSPDLVFQTICDHIVQAGDTPRISKIKSQVERAYLHFAGQSTDVKGVTVPAKPGKIPEFRPEVLAKLAARADVSNIEVFISDRSPFCPQYIDSYLFLSRLYNPGEKAVIFTSQESQGQVVWSQDLPREQLPVSGPAGVWFLVQPVDGKQHPNPRQGNKLSRRSQESVTAFRYVVLESDEAETDQWLRFLAMAPFRIVAIYYSGSRSVHALVRIDAKSKEDWDRQISPVKPLLALIGADPQALSAVRLSRLPQAWRGEKQQRLIYLNPAADGTPIMGLGPRPAQYNWLDYVEFKLSTHEPIEADNMQAALESLCLFESEPAVADVLARLHASYPQTA
jgi:hypothetical protein